MGLRIALSNSNLFSIDSCDLLPSSQYILLNGFGLRVTLNLNLTCLHVALIVSFSFFLLFHPRDYYKLSLCATVSNTFDNLWKSWRAPAQWRLLYKLQYNLMSLVASMLGCFPILFG